MKNIFKIIGINFLIFFFLYTIVEILSGNLLKNKGLPCYYILCNLNYKIKNNFYLGADYIHYNKDQYGFRGRSKDIDKIDILAVGGSTTDERYLNLKDTWTDKLEKKFHKIGKHIDVVNAGIDGQSTTGHIWNFRNWFEKIKSFKAKYIIFYIGINEQEKHHQVFDHKHISLKAKLKHLLKSNNGITYKLYFRIKHYNSEGVMELEHNPDRKKSYTLLTNNNQNDFSSLIYNLSKRLEKLHKLTIKLNSIPIFITQRTHRWKIKDKAVFSYNNTDYYLRERLISDKILDFCKSKKLICVDIFDQIDFDSDDTYDLVHTTPNGSTKIANIIFDNINELKF